MLIGYARVSTDEQKLDQQVDALLKYGIDMRNIFQEQVSTRSKVRPQLDNVLRYLEEGDTLVVCKLDRLGRSLFHLKELMDLFKEQNISFVSLSEQIDTQTAVGKMIFHMISSFAEFERDLISERTKDALQSLKKKGISLGRPFILNTEQKEAIDRYLSEGMSILAISRLINVKSRTPIYNYLKGKNNE